MRYTVALAEDNPINKKAFLHKIQQLPGYTVLFTAVSGADCLQALKESTGTALPQVVFMDIEMPGLTGIETIAIARTLYPQLHFIVLTVFDDEDKIFDAIKAGASGYLLKHEPANVLHESVLNVLEHGGAPMSPAIARKALQLLSHSARPGAGETGDNLPSVISEREKEILEYTVNGWNAKRIGAQLNISSLTVRKHVANIYHKLQVQSRAQIIQLAHKNNWFNNAR